MDQIWKSFSDELEKQASLKKKLLIAGGGLLGYGGWKALKNSPELTDLGMVRSVEGATSSRPLTRALEESKKNE